MAKINPDEWDDMRGGFKKKRKSRKPKKQRKGYKKPKKQSEYRKKKRNKW